MNPSGTALTRRLDLLLLKALPGLAHERDGLGEDARDHGADLLGLRLGVALDVDSPDGSDSHVDGELDCVVGPHETLVALHLFCELSQAPLQLLGVAEQISESTTVHARIIDCAAHAHGS